MPGQLLGCGVNTASIWDRAERRKLADLDAVTCLEYTRELDDLSEATVTIGREGDCCEVLDGVRTWHHSLVIYRDSKLVWSGPIIRSEYRTGETEFLAVDRLGWLDRRLVRTTREECGALTEIAKTLVEEGLFHPDGQPDETGLRVEYLPCMHTPTCREYEAWRGSTAAELRNLARGPLNFTVLGRRMIVWCGGAVLGRTSMLQDKDFMGDLAVVEDGYQLATAVLVQGDGVEAYCGGTDPYFGLLETIVKDDSITTVEAARQLACQEVAARNRPPLVLSVPDGIRLDPRAPVGFDELVPGVTMPIWSSATCRTVRQDMALTRVKVRQGCSDESGDEEVSVTVAPVDSIGAEGEGT